MSKGIRDSPTLLVTRERSSEPRNKKQQEPRLLANYANDDNMLSAYANKKDLYATVAAGVYKNDYWDNMEYTQDGNPNAAGKKRRNAVKSLVLGIMYGRGVASIAEQLSCSFDEAQKLIDNFYNGFPKVKQWVDKTVADAKINGYVEDLWGRRRRLPDIQLPKYTIKAAKANSATFNPIFGSTNSINPETEKLIQKYKHMLGDGVGYREYAKIKQAALSEGIQITDNGGFIAQSERQCVNARVQGGAATMSKKAMLLVHKDKELSDLGFKLLLTVHDELIGECPKETAEQAAKRLSEVMIHCAEPECTCPMKCDTYIVSRWYEDDFSSYIKGTYDELISKGGTHDEVATKLMEEHPMIESEYLFSMMKGTYICAVNEKI